MMLSMRSLATAILVLVLVLVGASSNPFAAADESEPGPGGDGDAPQPPVLVEFEVQLAPSSSGKFTVEVHPEWAPLGAQRFLDLVDGIYDGKPSPTISGEAFWKGVRFFRVIDGFMAQFGIAGKHDVSAIWRDSKIVDDPVIESNKRGYLSFATSGKDSRTTQMFINLVDNINLDSMDFAPFAKVVGDSMAVVDRIYSGYGEGAPNGKGPDQGRIQDEGNRYLKRQFPNLSYVKSVRRVEPVDGGGDGGGTAKEEL